MNVKRQRSEASESTDALATEDIFSLLSPLQSGGQEKSEGGSDWLSGLTPAADSRLPRPASGAQAPDSQSAATSAREDSFIASVFADEGMRDAEMASSSSAPAVGSFQVPSNEARTAATSDEVEALMASLPQHYSITTTKADRELHARLVKCLRGEGASSAALTSWVPYQDASGARMVKLHAIFRDRCGSSPTPTSPSPRIPASRPARPLRNNPRRARSCGR